MPASLEQRRALDQLFSVTYEELRRLASSVRRGDPSATLSPTALVNEAWLKLADSAPLGLIAPTFQADCSPRHAAASGGGCAATECT